MRDADGDLTVCELCFLDAPPEEVLSCELDQNWRPLEETLIAEVERAHPPNPTLIAFALTNP